MSPEKKAAAAAAGFSHSVRSGDLVFCSGQVGIDRDGNIPSDPEQQYGLAFAALEEVLADAGCRTADVVELTSYHTSYPEHMTPFMRLKADFLQGALPAWTAVGVASLGTPGTLVEIKAVARAAQTG